MRTASVAAKTLTMVQVGFLSIITEFVGAVALGARVTSTIKNGIISINRFQEDGVHPGTLMLAMGCAEVGSATWLMVATRMVRICNPLPTEQLADTSDRVSQCLPLRLLLAL